MSGLFLVKTPSGSLARLEGVSWSAGDCPVLDAVELEVVAGECLVIVGPNGAGKTTLLRLLAGLLEPSGGRLSWGDTPYDQLSRRELARRIAYVPQVRPSRIPLTVEQLVLLGRYPHMSRFQMAPSLEDFEAVERALRQVGLESLRGRRLNRLSGGERQAVFIAAALAQDSELLVLDEPTTHLDPSHQRDIVRHIRAFHESSGRTVVVATHDLNFASLIADRVAPLKAGSLLTCDPPSVALQPARLAELFDAPFEVVRNGKRPLTLLELDG